MGVHVAAAIFAVYFLGPPAIPIGASIVVLGACSAALSVLAIVWILNLFNFMDGIDGIAASEGAFILFGAAGLQLVTADISPNGIAPALILGAACLGFLMWNWQPAAIFMGDVGSGYLGYAIAVLALESSRTNTSAVYTWVILGGVFLVDATLTLFRRLLRRERVYQAHRTHAYQWLARRWNSHSNVTVAVIAIDILWLFPCAALAAIFPTHAPWICLIALTPLAACGLVAGSGRAE
jgi:Fuc2NAc and GlcNAc transferase